MNEYDLMRNALSRYGLDRGAVYRAARQAGAVAATKGAPTMKKSRVTGFAAVLAAVCLGAGVCAAGYYLTAGQAAREMGESAVAQLLESPDAVTVNETQTDAGYDVTLLGMVTGEHLTDAWSGYWNGDAPQNGTTYAVLSVSRSDGQPMPARDEDETFGLMNSFAQARLARPELSPAEYWLDPERQDVVVDGVRYLLVACDNVEIFADQSVVLCVSTGSPFYSNEAFSYDPATGAITANEEYEGVNLVFTLPLDASKADPEAAQEFLNAWKTGEVESSLPEEGAAGDAAGLADAVADMADTASDYPTPESVRAVGELLTTETVPFAQDVRMEDGTPMGDGWQIGDGAFFGDGFAPQQGTCSVLAVSDMDGQTLAYLGTLNADNTMTVETWKIG